MNTQKYPHLFTPITLANTVFNNRIFASATGPTNLDSNMTPSLQTCAQYERKAIGGAASVCIGNCSVDTVNGRSSSSFIDLSDKKQLSPLFKVSDAISRHGSVPSIELTHGGNHSFGSYSEGNPIYGPIEFIDDEGRHIYQATDEIIEKIIDQFARAAAFSKQCGFRMVTIHGGHGWLISQFVSPISNTRSDRWGGTVENRCRLPVAICKAIRKTCGPDFPIEIRISGSECHPGGYDIDEGIAISKQLDGHADIIHVSAGSHEVREVFTVTHPSMFLEDGVNVKYAAEIKKHVKHSSIATVGALADPEQMEEIIAMGKADIIALARGLLADPDLPTKARTGRNAEINTCMRCLACFSNRMQMNQYLCAINPKTGHEMEDLWVLTPAKKKRILIAGGGVAGMQAALTASSRGHDVIICEKSNALGGVLLCEQEVPFKKNLSKYISRQTEAVMNAGIDVLLNTSATPLVAEKYCPDVIIAALGARPITPKIKGMKSNNTFQAADIFYDISKAGKAVVIIGGGLVGMELGIYLAMNGRKVDIVEVLSKLNFGSNHLHALAVEIEMKKYGIEAHLDTKVIEIIEQGLIAEGAGGQKHFYADTIIYAVGQEPLRDEASKLQLCSPEFYQIGDCLTPKSITEATRTAYHTARYIGRV